MAYNVQATTTKTQEQEKKKLPFSVALQTNAYQKMINNTLGDPRVAKQFITDITTVVSTNEALKDADAGSILSAGLTAQSMKLPLSPTLGFCYVLPFNVTRRDSKGKVIYENGQVVKDKKAQFQISYKGIIQLAQRSGQFERLGVKPVHKGEYLGQDEFGDDTFKFSHECDENEVVGYFAYFKLLNGFKKTMYWTKAQCEAHGRKYSKSFDGLWKSDFDTMAQKTVLKLLLSKYAPMSVDMQTAFAADQGVIENNKVTYVDNDESTKSLPTNVIKEEPKVEPATGEIIDNDDPLGVAELMGE